MNIDDAKIELPDGRVAYDCVKLAQVVTEGVFVKELLNHEVVVRTRNTTYTFTVNGLRENLTITGVAAREDGVEPRYLAKPSVVNIHGSTWGGSMLKMGYIGVDMHLEFSVPGERAITTSNVESVTVKELS